jgi:hypothetical protein
MGVRSALGSRMVCAMEVFPTTITTEKPCVIDLQQYTQPKKPKRSPLMDKIVCDPN